MDKNEILRAVGDGMQAALKEFAAQAIDPLKAEFSSSMAAVKNEIAEIKGKQATLEAAVLHTEPKTEEEKPAPAAAPAGTVQKLTASDFASIIGESVKSAIEAAVAPLSQTVESLKASLEEKDEQTGIRKSLTASQVEVLTKYGDLEDEAEPSVENYQRACEMVASDARLTRDKKLQIIGELSAAKRALIRAGGVQ